MTRSITRRTLATLAFGFCALFGLSMPSPALAAPAPVSIVASDAPRVAATTEPATDDDLAPEDVADWVKDNAPLVTVVVGILLVIGFWKFITR